MRTGDTVPARVLLSVLGQDIQIPSPDRRIHLQFRRFAGCPICNLHLRQIVLRHAEIEAAGIAEVVLFHSSVDELAPHAEGLPFPLVADPEKHVYTEFGVGTSRKALRPAAWGAIVAGVGRDAIPVLTGRKPGPPRQITGGRLGLPADFLIDPTGRIAAAHHGTHAADQWSVDDLLNLAARVG